MPRLLMLVALLLAPLLAHAQFMRTVPLGELVNFEEPVDTLEAWPEIDVGSDSQFMYFSELLNEGILGAHLYSSDGNQVASFQDINNFVDGSAAFSKALFFMTEYPVGKWMQLDEGQDVVDCNFYPCTYHEVVLSINWVHRAQVTASLSANPIPEPETYAMLLAGLGLIGFRARRRTLAV